MTLDDAIEEFETGEPSPLARAAALRAMKVMRAGITGDYEAELALCRAEVERRFGVDRLHFSLDREDDGRFIAEAVSLPGVLAYGETAEAALSAVYVLALRAVAERVENGEAKPPTSVLESVVNSDSDTEWLMEMRAEARSEREPVDEST